MIKDYVDSKPVDFQHLEDLATAYWYSEVLFAALDLGVFRMIESGHTGIEDLARAVSCVPGQLKRFLEVLDRLGLVQRTGRQWQNRPATRQYLLPDSPSYMGDFLLYRRYMKTGWESLVATVSGGQRSVCQGITPDSDYHTRTYYYVRALDQLARRKASEIADILATEAWNAPILDVGGGAGAVGRALISLRPKGQCVLFDLSEVLDAARRVYPASEHWKRVQARAGDFRSHEFSITDRYGLIVFSNFLHTYSAAEAEELVDKAAGLLSPGGCILVHDYFPDREPRSPHKGGLYDLSMMLNTFNGSCHTADAVEDWLRKLGATQTIVRDLPSDSSLIIARL